MQKFILSLDQGTSSSRAIIFNKKGAIKAVAQKEFRQYFPQPGWVEHDPEEIWSTQRKVAEEVVRKVGGASKIETLGITNQRETTILWERMTGKPVYNAIVWQDRRTSGYCDSLKKAGFVEKIKQKTGLIIDPYFSATKIQWILDHVPGTRKKVEKGELAFGTIDSWLLWQMTKGKKHLTDITNASRTMLFNIHTLEWDTELLSMMNIPLSIMPEVCSSSEIYGETSFLSSNHLLPISGIAGDQQAALFGQQCIEPGMAKNTYGTGCFIVMNTGESPKESNNNLLTTIAWKRDGKVYYALEGSIFIAGAAIQWLRDGLGLIKSSSEIETLANKVTGNGGVYFVPALSGLGAPYWDQYARGMLIGITRGTNKAHIARATLEAICYQSLDVIRAMELDAGLKIAELRVDGGGVINNLLMQIQADLLQIPLIRPLIKETTALGAAYLAGLAVGYWENTNEIQNIWKTDQVFSPVMKENETKEMLLGWKEAVKRSMNWSNDPGI